MTERDPIPWWLEEGSESCGSCLSFMHYEARVVCAECDAPTCPVCAVDVLAERLVFCPACAEERS